MAVVNRGIATVQLVDFSRETQQHQLFVPQLTAGNIVAQTALWDAYIAALNNITQCNVYTKVMGNQQANVPINPPIVMEAQRGKQWLVGFTDTVTAARLSIRIAGAIYTNNLKTHSDHADLTATDIAAFVTAFEAFAQSPDGNAVEINDIVVVGNREGLEKLQY